MTLRLKTKAPEEKIIPLLKDSIAREIKYLNIGLKKTKERIKFFQSKYKSKSTSAPQNIDALDRVEWEGEELTFQKIKEKIGLLKGIEI